MNPKAGAKPEVRVPRPAPGDPMRILVVAAAEHVTEALRDELGRRGDGRPVEVRIVAPALAESRLEHISGNIDEARAEAQERLTESIEEVRASGLEAEGRVGDSDPLLAIEDALREAPAHEIVLVTHRDAQRWLEDDMFERVLQHFDLPVAHYEVDADGHTLEREAGVGPTQPADAEVRPSENLPRLSVRDLAGIVVAIVGTIVLIVLASTDAGDASREGADPAQVARMLIAGGFGLINLAHVVALLLFGSLRYRGFWERFFAHVSLWGTLGAIVVSLILLVA